MPTIPESPTPEAFACSFEDHVEPHKSADGTLGFWAFVLQVLSWAKQLARDQVDTEEERDAIVDGAMLVADRVVAPKFPWGWAAIRPLLREGLDQGIDYLPTLLA